MQRLQRQFEALAGDDAATLAALQPVVDARSAARERQVEATRSTLLGPARSRLQPGRGPHPAQLHRRDRCDAAHQLLPQRARAPRADGGPRDYVSYKLDSALVPDLPKPRPYREIWVYGPRVEGVHLRFGPVARGGLRWSDRREDFRTEVLGLVKAQMVKNTVIVPVGSKGGFFCKQLPSPAVDRDAGLAEGIACYQRFINGLLDITDNLVGGDVVHPEDVVRHDGDDP